MNRPSCSRTDDLLAARRRDELAADDRRHLSTCASCSAAVASEDAMAALAAGLARRAKLPSAQVVHLRARLEARRRLAERSLRPLTLWRTLVAGLACAALAIGGALSGPLFAGLAPARGAAADPVRLLGACVLVALLVLPFSPRLRAPVR